MESRSQEIFERYLKSSAPAEDPEALLEELLVGHAQALVKRAVERKLGRLYNPTDAADLAHEAIVELLARLRALRADPGAAAFRFDALATAVAANTVHRHWARCYPEWGRLRKRLRYALETGGFRLWRNPQGGLVCGLAGADPAAGEAGVEEIEKCRGALAGGAGQPLAELARQILELLPRGIGFNALTALVSRLAGIRDAPPEPAGATGENPAESVADPAPAAGERLELRERVTLLWREIRELPERQRSALLLHLRTTHGAALWLLADLGVARFGELADCLAMGEEELAEIWNRLPLEDAEIAGRLGLERQQIVNLRQAARQRLARRIPTGRSAPIRPRNRS